MELLDRPQAILVTEDGRVFRGRAFGASGETFGELVFSTGMSGYQETLTDPSYHRQIVVATAPHVGNTGWNDEDNESARIWVSGYAVRDPAPGPSSWRSTKGLESELINQGVVGICDIDTRALTRHIRESGVLRAAISSNRADPISLLNQVRQSPSMAGSSLVADVTTAVPYLVPARGQRRFVVAALDLGIKSMTPIQLAERGMDVHVLPADATFDQIMSTGPDGVFFSNGPGDPATANSQIELLTQVLSAGLPYFGICLGNQLFGLALGFDTYKLKYGHRGINQPVLDRGSGRVEITAHNHGFAVDAPLDRTVDTPFGQVRVSHVCLNDDVVEGLELSRDGQVIGLSVQYHPEAAAGPHDASYLFDRFAQIMKQSR